MRESLTVKNMIMLLLAGIIINLPANLLAEGKAGTNSAEFLKLGIGARAIGLGEAYSAVCTDASSIYWNPAGLARQLDHSIFLMHGLWLQQTTFDYLAYSQRIDGVGSLGLGVEYFNTGILNETDSYGNIIGEFTPKDGVINLAWAQDVSFIDFGINCKYISSQIKEKAHTYSCDVGFIFLFSDKLRVSLSGQNLKGSLKYISETESLPTTYKLGAKVNLIGKSFLAFDAVKPKNESVYFNAGLELRKEFMRSNYLALRSGYSSRTKGRIDGLAGFTAGLGFRLKNFYLDYAWSPYGDLGQGNVFSIAYNFKAVTEDPVNTNIKDENEPAKRTD